MVPAPPVSAADEETMRKALEQHAHAQRLTQELEETKKRLAEQEAIAQSALEAHRKGDS